MMDSSPIITRPSSHANHHPDKFAYRMADSDTFLTFTALNDASNHGARFLRGSGLHSGQGHIALLAENSLDFFKI